MDTLVSMQVFRRVVELESFVAAANRMDMSPAMVSKHVMHLERHLKARLLNRTSRHLSLTEIGHVYFDRCCEMLDDLEEVEATVRRTTVIPSGVLKLSAPSWYANRKFTKILADYQTQYPMIKLEIELTGRMVNLVEEGFDLALRVTQSPNPKLITQSISSIEFYLVGSPKYLRQAGYPLTLQDLLQHSLVIYSLIESEVAFIGKNGIETIKMDSIFMLKTNDENLIYHAVMDSIGLAFLPVWLVESDLATGNLERVLPDYQIPQLTIYATYTSRKYLSSKVHTFVDFMINCKDLH